MSSVFIEFIEFIGFIGFIGFEVSGLGCSGTSLFRHAEVAAMGTRCAGWKNCLGGF